MDDVTLSVNHDIPVMTILDLEDVACDTISCHALNKVHPSPLKFDGVD